MATERTPLRAGPPGGPGAYDQAAPTYVFMTNPGRAHRTKIRQFQCCVCAAILGVFVMALVITVSYSVEHDDIDNNRTTPEPPTTTTALPPANGTLQLLLGSSWPKPDAASPPWPGPQPDEAALRRAVAQGRQQLAARAALEATMTPMQRDTPAYRANQAVHTRPEATAMAQRALLEEKATKQLLNGSEQQQLSAKSAAGRGPRLRSVAADAGAGGADDAACADDDLPLPCPSTPYRSADGTCNNVDHPRTWGVAMRPFRRALPPAYLDGVSEPRGVLQGLPSAREVSLGVHRPLYRNDPDFTVMLAVWGQFIDHDITATALSQAADGSAISCCDVDPAQQHPECFPVRLAPGDPYYHKYNVTCMEFVRSAPAPTCSLGQREQLNQASSYLDASVVYGPSAELMKSLREDPTHLTEDRDGNVAVRPSAGRLKMTLSPDGRELLPVSQDPADGCNRQEMNDRGRYCFKSGDGRANENLHLTTMHLLLARQHNRLAATLQSTNPQWSDERVFQEARRIVAAQMQHVTYNEFLPVILGPRMMEQMDLNPKAAGYDSSYDPAVDPTIANSFAASSFRFAHTLLPGLLKLIGNDTSSPEYVELHQMLFDPYSLYSREGADRALRGAMDTSIEKADNYFNAEVTTKLFAPRSIGRGSSGQPACGLDLVSLNVQRGRDHGLQPYPAWREHCGFPRPATWDDLDGVMDEESLQRMKQIYKSVDDVDVYTGALSEYPVETGLLGGTLTCLLGDQFVRLKRGDRFWYETDQQPQAFTPAQLAEIRKTSLASIICSTSDGVHSAQPKVMRRAQGGSNKRVPCAQLPRTSLRAWVERDGRYVIQRADVLAATGHEPRDQDNVPDELVLVGAASDSAGLTPTAARAVRVGGRVTSGSVTTSSGASLWSGGLPAPIPARGSGTFLAGGVAWEGSLVASGSTASLRGTFAVDAFSAAAGALPQPGERVEGRFDLDLDVQWDSSSDGIIDLSGSFRSPVYLRAEDGQHDRPLVSPKGEGGPLAPVILHGQHDANGTFLWDGNVTLVLPTMAQDSVIGDDDVAEDDEAHQLLSSAYSPAVAPSSPQVRIVAEVLSGSVTAQGEGGAQVTWWDGSLPTNISTSPFDAHSTDVSPAGAPSRLAKPSARLDGVLWTATVAASSPTTAQVSGTFKAPRFVHGNNSGAGVQVEWWSGSFALNLRLLGRVDDEVEGGLEALLVSNQQYTSRLLFQTDSPSPTDPAAEPRAPLELMAAAQEVADGAVPAPVILKGAFSADGKSFSWSGKATLVLPRPPGAPPSPAVQMLGQKRAPHWARPRHRLLATGTPSGPRIVATVRSGTVTAGPEGQSATSVWSGSFPAAIPMPLLDSVRPADPPSAGAEASEDAPLYAHGLIWKGALSTSGTTATLVGTFLAPRFLHAPHTGNATGFAMEWWKGSFSLELEPTWAGSLDGAIDSTATYSSPVYFKGPSKASVEASLSQAGQRTPLSAFVAASLEQSEGATRAPLILQGTYSADRTVFYWSGALVLALPPPAPPLPPLQAASGGPAPAPAPGPLTVTDKTPTPVRRIGVRVTTGNMYAYPEGAWFWRTWWSGNLPAAVPVPLFDSFKYEYAPYPTGPLYHACGVDWKGSITATSPSTVRIQGKFSMPHYRHSTTGVTITWYYGTFLFEGDLLWSTSLQGLDGLDGASFSSHLYFKSQKPLPISKYPVRSAPSSPSSSLQQFVADSVGIQDGAVRVPIVLDGNYSPDRHTFFWSGDAVLTVPEPTRPVLTLQAKAKTKVKKADTSKPTKPAKPVQPPKLRLMGMVVGGSVNATYDNSTETEIWSGAVPMWLPNPLSGLSSWDLDSTIKWSGTLSTLDKSGKLVQLDGEFTAPFYEQGTDGVIQHEWKGTFSVQLRNMFTSVTHPELLKQSVKYTSKVVFVPPKAASGGDGSDSAPQLVLTDSQGQNLAVIVLQGQYWFWSKSWFWWNGVASVAVPLDDNSGVNPNAYAKPDKQMAVTRVMASPTGIGVTSLQAKAKKDDASSSKPTKPAKPVQPPKLRLMGMVVGGSVNATYDNSTETEIWSGAVPMWLPNPLSGLSSWDLDSTIKWSGTLSTLDKSGKLVQLDGEFTAPFYEQGADGVIQHEWKGTFSVQLRNMFTSVTHPELLKRSVKYTSKVVFVPPKAASGGDGSDSAPQLVLTDSQGQNLAVIVLQGQYWFWSKSWFWWNGVASVAVPLDDNSGVNPNAYAKPDKQMAVTRVMASPESVSTATAKVAVAVVEGKVTAQRSDGTSPTTWWSGELPATIPSSPFDGVAADGSAPFNRSTVGPGGVARGVSWTGSLRPLTDAGDNGDAILEGSFRLPRFLHSAAGSGFSIEWWTGMFTLRLRPLAGSSLARVLSQTATYSSPVVFKAMEANESIATLLKQSGEDNADMGFVMASDAASQGADKLVVLLQGSYSPDRTTFSWTGNAVLELPASASASGKKLPLRRLTASANALVKKKASTSSSSFAKIGAVVTSGTVSAARAGGAPTSVWSGTLPVSLPVGGGSPASVLWSGSLKQNSPTSATLAGTFSTALPEALLEAGTNTTLAWWSGDFTLQLQLMWNASVANCIQTGVKYVTPLYYRSAKQQQSLLQRVASLGQELASGGQQVLAFLDGDYSADKVSFLWSGRVFLSLPKDCVAYSTPAPRSAPLALKASAVGGPAGGAGRVAVGAVVTSGWITPSLWSGSLPVAVPVAAVRSLRPLSWTGTLTRGSAGTVSVKGKYAAPQYNHDGGVLAVDWIGGDFSFTARTLWDTGATLDSALTGTANYTSVVHLQNSDSLRALEDVQNQVPAVWDRMIDSASSPLEGTTAATKVPIVLQGEFAVDGTTFMWSGGVLIGLPVAA